MPCINTTRPLGTTRPPRATKRSSTSGPTSSTTGSTGTTTHAEACSPCWRSGPNKQQTANESATAVWLR